MKSKQYEVIQHSIISEIAFSVLSFSHSPAHFHQDLEIDLILEGSVRVRSHHDLFQAQSGSVLIFNSYEPHELSSIGKACKILTVYIKQDFCKNYFPSLAKVRFTRNHILSSDFDMALALEDTDSSSHYICGIRRCLFNLGYNYYLNDFGFELRCYSDLNSLVYALIKIVPYTLISGDNERPKRIIDYIENNYTQKISLAKLAELEGVSESHLSRYIKKILGISFQEYVSILRFEKAIQLLIHTDFKLLDICIESGFSEGKYLNKMFEEHYHMSPKEFRKQIANDKNFYKSRVLYSMEESLELLRKHYAYSCDMRK